MSPKKILVALLIIAVAVGGFVAGLVLLQENQDIEEEASTPTGTATATIKPESGNYDVGDTIDASVYFDPNGTVINGVAVRLNYPFSGSTPEVTVASIDVNSSLLSSGDWTCPTQDSNLSGDTVIIDIACANTSAEGFTANTDTLLAEVKLNVTRTPQASPFVIRFDNVNSVMYRKSDNQDILLVPASTGSYTVGGAEATVVPTASVTSAVTVTPTLTPRITATLTPTSTPSSTLTPTPTTVVTKGGEQLPDAGVSLPTVFGVSFGILVIAGAVLLAL
ncbi:hypothetical protein ACFL25_00085 [Patescibacteria group bacterium]